MSLRVEVRPRMLHWARARSGIDDETLAKRSPHYDEWLAGRAAPTVKQLEGAA